MLDVSSDGHIRKTVLQCCRFFDTLIRYIHYGQHQYTAFILTIKFRNYCLYHQVLYACIYCNQTKSHRESTDASSPNELLRPSAVTVLPSGQQFYSALPSFTMFYLLHCMRKSTKTSVKQSWCRLPEFLDEPIYTYITARLIAIYA